MPDDADDADFVPCRDDKCKIDRLHPAHPLPPDNRREVITLCPECEQPIIQLQHKRGMCSRCPWRGPTAIDRPTEEESILKKIRKKSGHA